MPVEYYFNETEKVRCVKVKLPVVLAEEEVQVTIENTTCLPELAKKIDKIEARVRDIEIDPLFITERPSREDNDMMEMMHMMHHCCKHDHHNRIRKIKRVTIHGTLHKQIFYVNKDDDVRHFSEDIPFTKTVDLPKSVLILEEDEVYATFFRVRVDAHWDMVKSSRVHQDVVVTLRLKVIEDRQIFVQVCPSPEDVCPQINLLQDPGFEAWSDSLVPIFWGGSNISQTTEAHRGQFAVEIGAAAPASTGSVFQTVNRISPGRQYQLSFWVRENVLGARVSNFSLLADVVFFDESGEQIDTSSNSVTATNIPDNSYQQLSFTTGAAPRGARTALIRFTFNPEANNTNAVKIDNVKFMCKA
ncbi:SPOCS domain-containing protein [Desulfolucanica intricata]|uniref:SPOCS domain-containing protein n=1 Tax=Desulfolucanica intricata TaxID=1285191 RepID=UPI0008348AE4|nr:SPOCS domain-containing protein [Desulfolucanica intricata]